MEETKDKQLLETTPTNLAQGNKGFAKIEMLLEATGGLSLSQVCAVTGLEGSTIQNWVKRGWVAHPLGKRYEEVHIARILIINALKECIKLENIVQLMVYVNGYVDSGEDIIIKEYALYDYLCSALAQLGQADDLSRSGVESVVDKVIVDYVEPTPNARMKIRKALSVMIYACVCTDVKRRTESMMQQILTELDNPAVVDVDVDVGVSEANTAEVPISTPATAPVPVDVPTPDNVVEQTPAVEVSPVTETRKTIAQALREWDLTRVEDILNEENEDEAANDLLPVAGDVEVGGDVNTEQAASDEKTAQKPWYFRRN